MSANKTGRCLYPWDRLTMREAADAIMAEVRDVDSGVGDGRCSIVDSDTGRIWSVESYGTRPVTVYDNAVQAARLGRDPSGPRHLAPELRDPDTVPGRYRVEISRNEW